MSRTPVSFKLIHYHKSFVEKTGKTISSEIHLEILKVAGEVIGECLLKDGEFKMGARIGILAVRMSKRQIAVTDFKKTKQYGRRILNFNDHSDGMAGMIYWIRKGALLADKLMWNFKAVRRLKRAVAVQIFSGRQYPQSNNKS